MLNLLALLLISSSTASAAADLATLQCKLIGLSDNYSVYQENGQLHLPANIRFDNLKSCEAALKRARKTPSGLGCLPAEPGISRMYGLYNFMTGQAVGKPVFGAERCDAQLSTAWMNFVCAPDAGLEKIQIRRFDPATSKALNDQQFLSLEDCKSGKAIASAPPPEATEPPAKPAAE